MATTTVPATRLKPGDTILLEEQGDEIFRVKKIDTSAPGKHGHSKVRIAYENLLTGSSGEVTYSGHHDIQKPVIEKERAQVISLTPSIVPSDPKLPKIPAVVQLMNLATFETYELSVPLDISEDDLKAGVELEIRVYASKKWIEKIVPVG